EASGPVLRGRSMTATGDLLAAASLILTVLTVLYSVWYPGALEALDLNLPEHYEDALPMLSDIRAVLRRQIIPLVMAATLATAIFLPKAIGVLRGTVDDLSDRGLHAFSDYDPIKATLVFVVAFTGFLAWQAFGLSLRLRTKLQSRQPEGPPPAPAASIAREDRNVAAARPYRWS